MPGFSDGLRIPQEFSPQLNIVTGPNASGKSSMARAIQKVVWPGNSSEYWLRAEAEVGSDAWLFQVNHGFAEAQRNGHSQSFQGPVVEEGHRYLLALHELVRAEDAELATEIHRQLSGGYDLDAAARSAGFNDHVSTKSLAEYKALDAARKKVRERTQEQEKLHREQEKLAGLHRELEVKNEALRKEKLFELALQFRQASLEKDNAKAHLKSFPAVLKNLAAQDLSQVESCELELSEAENEIRTAEARLQELTDEMNRLGLPESGLPEALEDRMAGILAELEQLTNARNSFAAELVRTGEKLKNAAENLQLKNPEAEWEGLPIDNLKPLEKEWLAAYQERAAGAEIEKEIESLEKKLEGFSADVSDRDELVHGIRSLTRWLQEQKGQSEEGIPGWTIYAFGALAIAGTAAGVFGNWMGLIFIVAIVSAILVFFALRKRNSGTSGNSADAYRTDFEHSNIPRPSDWNPEEIARHISVLAGHLQVIAERSALNEQLSRSKEAKKRSDAELKNFNATLAESREALGFIPGQINTESAAGMYWMLANACKWQEARDARDGASAELQTTESSIRSQLESFNAILKDLQIDSAGDFATARAVYERLRRAEQKRREAEVQIRVARRLKDSKLADCEKLNKKIDSVYERMEIGGRNRHALQMLHNQLEAYLKAEREAEMTRHKAENLDRELRNHSLYHSEELNLEGLSTEELEQHISGYSEIKIRRDQLHNEIGGIVALVEKHKKSHDLESALNDEDTAFENLESAFEENLLRYTGQVVVDSLRSVHHAQNDSKLYKSADELFRTITRQRFSLLIPDGADKSFRAFDEVKRTGLGLSELSTGTRIQLLLAVRLAYIETQEQHYRLPLLADELLANSDDVRAQAIIEALVEISRAGRQVFYFTAQSDEVYKWQQYLKQNPDVDFEVISLEGTEGKEFDFTGLENGMAEKSTEVIPEPQNVDHRQYGETIKVPHFDLIMHPVSQLHLWYLTDDTEFLYQCLRNQLRHWVQIKSMEKTPPYFSGEDWPAVFNQLSRRAELVNQLQKLYRIGRPKRVDRADLLKSEAVSGNYINAVGDLLEQVNGNPEQLLFSLENKAVAGFRTNKIEELREYFEREGKLATGKEPLSHEELMEQMYAVAAGLHIDAAEMEKVLQRVLTQNS